MYFMQVAGQPLRLKYTRCWVLQHDAPASRDDLVVLTHAWNDRKKRFSPRQIGLAADVLKANGWIGSDCAGVEEDAAIRGEAGS